MEHNPRKTLLFNNIRSVKPILNISEMLFCTDPTSMNEAMYWFYTALKHYQTHDPTNLHKCKISMAIFSIGCRDFINAEKLLVSVIKDLEGTDNYLRVAAMWRLGKTLIDFYPKRREEG